MIKPNRLKELIEQGATIYDIFKGDIYLIDLTMAKYYDVPKYIEYKNYYYNCYLTRSIDDLFETKEDALWELEFGNITREEKLSLPSWEEIKEKGSITFFSDKNYLGFITPLKCIIINNYRNGDTILNKPLTKENYINACSLCKQLFLGEIK